MLFDLQGKRRRVVQVTYLSLAVLMGGGLVLFGIGSNSGTGGLFDIFSGGGGNSGNEVIEERVDTNEQRVEETPRAEAPRKQLVRDYYQLAVAQTDQGGKFPPEAQDELRRADIHWGAYQELEKGKPDAGLARVALQIYDPVALNDPDAALQAARIVAEDGGDANSYLLLVQYATAAGDKRTKQLASQKAIDVAPKRFRKQVRAQLKEIASQYVPIPAGQAPAGQAPGSGAGQ
jgi:hypothetical protein